MTEAAAVALALVGREESPDSTEQEVPLTRDTPDHMPGEGKRHRKNTALRKQGKGEMVRQELTGRPCKRRCKASPFRSKTK